MKRIVLLAALVALASGASAWRAFNSYDVYPVSDKVFEVVSEVGAGAADYWCGAGDFAYRGAGARGAQRVYIWRALGPSITRPGRKAVQFSLVPPPGADTDPKLTLSVDAVGDNLRAAAAQQYCFGNDPEDGFPYRP